MLWGGVEGEACGTCTVRRLILSASGVAAELTKRAIPTAPDGESRFTTVLRLLERLKLDGLTTTKLFNSATWFLKTQRHGNCCSAPQNLKQPNLFANICTALERFPTHS